MEFIGKPLLASSWTDPYLRLSGWGNEEGVSALSILVGAAMSTADAESLPGDNVYEGDDQ